VGNLARGRHFWRLLRLTNETIKRMEALEGAFSVSSEHTKGKKLLPFDDLYGSGATVSAITQLLKGPGRSGRRISLDAHNEVSRP
jgi:predicted amidophosphoribosyltransferase